jgi:hypothetical protein
VYRTLAGLLLTSVLSASLSAQAPDDPIEDARFQTGPIGLSPAIALTGFGVDTNVFNDFDDPRRDLTFTVSPMLDTWLRAGRSRLHVFTRTDLMYFHQYASGRIRPATMGVRDRSAVPTYHERSRCRRWCARWQPDARWRERALQHLQP